MSFKFLSWALTSSSHDLIQRIMSTHRAQSLPGRRKPHQFRLPDGTRVVVALPDDLATLKQRQAALPDDPAEVILHGSDEHHAYLARSRDHHERERQALRERHGPAFDQWESVQAQLDDVTRALDRLGDRTSALSSSFSKFGFAAHLRTYDDDDEGGGSGAATARSGSGDGSSEASTLVDFADRNSGQTMKLFKRPVIKQYFHKGLIWRASEEAQIMSFELFFDLLYGEISCRCPEERTPTDTPKSASSTSMVNM